VSYFFGITSNRTSTVGFTLLDSPLSGCLKGICSLIESWLQKNQAKNSKKLQNVHFVNFKDSDRRRLYFREAFTLTVPVWGLQGVSGSSSEFGKRGSLLKSGAVLD
jgi:hypothetical protein